MEQIISRRYSEDCQVPAVEFEYSKTVLDRIRNSDSRSRISGHQRAKIFRCLFSLLPPLFSRVSSPIWSSSSCTESTKITHRRWWIVVRHRWKNVIGDRNQRSMGGNFEPVSWWQLNSFERRDSFLFISHKPDDIPPLRWCVSITFS
jgi:hypothetical protein